MPETAKSERKVETPTAIQEAEYRRTIWLLNAASGTQPDDVLVPEYWAHVGAKLKPWDRIEVRAADGTWYTELMVLDASRQWARVKTLVGPVMLTSADVSLTQTQAADACEVMHRGPRKWSVVRKSDRAVMHEGEERRDAAEQWLAENAGALKAQAPA